MLINVLKFTTQVVTKVPLKTIGTAAGIVGGIAGIVGGEDIEEVADSVKEASDWLDDTIEKGLSLLEEINFL